MLSKKFPVKPKTINFSSEDSQDTDASMNSSIDGNDLHGKYSVANKFNQLRETMNKYFMANPELADELKFEKYSGPEDNYQHNFIQGHEGSQSPKEKLPSPRKLNQKSLSAENRDKQSPSNKHDNSLKLQTEGAAKLSGDSSKLWSAISRELNKGQKNTRAPTSSQVTHMLNLYKQNFEKPAVLDTTMTSPKGIVGNSPRRTHIDRPADFRIQSAKSMKEGGKGKSKDGKGKKGDKEKQDEEDDDGVIYFSVRKKKHLQMKHEIRKQMELNRELRKKEAEEREKQAKERDQKNVMNTLADLDEELNRKGVNANSHAHAKEKEEAPARKKRRNSTKMSTNIFDRLTKDTTTRDQDDSINKAPNNKVFTSELAEELYNEMKSYGNSETFKRVAQHKLNAFKREFKENMAKQKTLPTEGLKFTKEDSRYFNTFLPDFERVANYSNKDSVFIHNEVVRGSEEWRENPENELLSKYSRIVNGTLFDIWREAKDLNQQL